VHILHSIVEELRTERQISGPRDWTQGHVEPSAALGRAGLGALWTVTGCRLHVVLCPRRRAVYGRPRGRTLSHVGPSAALVVPSTDAAVGGRSAMSSPLSLWPVAQDHGLLGPRLRCCSPAQTDLCAVSAAPSPSRDSTACCPPTVLVAGRDGRFEACFRFALSALLPSLARGYACLYRSQDPAATTSRETATLS
jgi:hypothetical protein